MTVKVKFPDDTVREMPSRSVRLESREVSRHRGPPTFIEEPLYDPEWSFEAVIGGWIANPR